MSATCCDCGKIANPPFDNGDKKHRCEKCAVKKYKGKAYFSSVNPIKQRILTTLVP
jgi:hypothetical protein